MQCVGTSRISNHEMLNQYTSWSLDKVAPSQYTCYLKSHQLMKSSETIRPKYNYYSYHIILVNGLSAWPNG
jgi:hypothetical protein